METPLTRGLPPRVSVAVIGGGPAGSATALELARDGVRVALVTGAEEVGWKVGESLPPAARPALERLGVWERFAADGHLPAFGNCAAWGAASLREHHFIFDPHGHGWHLDRRRLDRMLAHAAAEAGALVGGRLSVTECQPAAGGGWELTLLSRGARPGRIEAGFVVDATGRRSWLGRRSGARRVSHDALVAAVALLAPGRESRGHGGMTLVEASEHGWWYCAPVPGAKLVAAFMTDGDLESARAARAIAGWRALLARTTHLGARAEADDWRIERGPVIVSANSAHLSPAAGESWLAVGDAAISCDPLSAQGILTALQSGALAADAIRAHFAGRRQALADYVRLVDGILAEYLVNRNVFYAQESRWASAPFWRRRQKPR